jgi:hypothetical protein
MEQLASLPPLAIIVFGVTLALIFGVRYMGLLSGAGGAPEKTQASAQVAAVIVDPTALNKLSAAGEAVNMTLIELVMVLKEKVRTEKQVAEELDSIREELRIQREISRRT